MLSFFRKLFTTLISLFKSTFHLLSFLLLKLFSLTPFDSTFSKNNNNLRNYSYYISNDLKNNMYGLLFLEKSFLITDLLSLFVMSFKHKLSKNSINLFRSYFRAINTKNGFYFNFKSFEQKSFFLDTLKYSFFSGLKSIWLGFRFWLVPLLVAFIIIYYSMVIRCVPFNKIVAFWVIFGMVAYWLLSGFVFFIKKYQFGKYTTAIQRFWRRSYILFWLIEFSLFMVYVYLTLNANQESFYMFDQIQVFKTHLFSWRLFMLKIFPLTVLLILGYFLLLSLKWNVLSKNSLLISIITLIIVNTVWVEFYQFFHVVNYYGNFNWIYEADEKMWSLELEPRKTRTVNHYVMLLLILKFWHIVLIVAFWVFFILRGLEVGRVRYPLLSANLQNFLILYLFAWVNMFPWIKFIMRRYIDMPYYWFYVNNREIGYRVFFNDMKLLWYGIVDLLSNLNLNNHLDYSFINWSVEDSDFLFSYRKTSIKNIILNSLEHEYQPK